MSATYRSTIPQLIADLPTLIDEAVLAVGNTILAQALPNVPVDTGALKRSGRVEVMGPQHVRVVFGGVGDIAAKRDVVYAAYVEFGSTRTTANGTAVTIRAQPFLGPAARSAKAIAAAATSLRAGFRRYKL
jgi:hypothetical protein